MRMTHMYRVTKNSKKYNIKSGEIYPASVNINGDVVLFRANEINRIIDSRNVKRYGVLAKTY